MQIIKGGCIQHYSPEIREKFPLSHVYIESFVLTKDYCVQKLANSSANKIGEAFFVKKSSEYKKDINWIHLYKHSQILAVLAL